jgi:hypothetical protein
MLDPFRPMGRLMNFEGLSPDSFLLSTSSIDVAAENRKFADEVLEKRLHQVVQASSPDGQIK